MPIVDVAAMSGAMKTLYGPELVWQIADKTKIRTNFNKSMEDWQGNFKEYPVGIGRAQSFMAHGSLGVFPTAQNEILVPTRLYVKWLHGRLQLETATMKQSATSKGAWARTMDLLMGRLKNNIADESNRMHRECGLGCRSSGSGRPWRYRFKRIRCALSSAWNDYCFPKPDWPRDAQRSNDYRD
jgi:hypothetical protein